MQTRTYGDLFKLIQSLAGVNQFATNEQDDIANLINRRFFEAYQTSQMWPRYLVPNDERKLAVINVKGNTSNPTRDGLYYKFGEDSRGNPVYLGVNTNNVDQFKNQYFEKQSNGQWVMVGGSVSKNLDTELVTTSGSASLLVQRDTSLEYDNPWDVIWDINSSGDINVVEKVQTVAFDEVEEIYATADTPKQKDTIGEFIRVHRTKPFENVSSLEYDFYVNNDGANILNVANLSDTHVFITYKKKFTAFTTSSNFTTSTEEVPSEFFHYIAHAAFADFLRMDGQLDKAQLEQANAEQYLALELERVDVIMNQTTVNKRFSTYVNRQSR
jgi:hypothetical protein